jgi:hypothetical protein
LAYASPQSPSPAPQGDGYSGGEVWYDEAPVETCVALGYTTFGYGAADDPMPPTWAAVRGSSANSSVEAAIPIVVLVVGPGRLWEGAGQERYNEHEEGK